MLRFTLIQLALFLSPFVAYAAYLLLRRQPVLDVGVWRSGPTVWLLMASIVAVIVGILVFATAREGATTGAWHPSQWHDGKFIPGRYE